MATSRNQFEVFRDLWRSFAKTSRENLMDQWIIESNRIEEIYDSMEDSRSQSAWDWFKKQELTLDNILKLHKRITWKQLKKQAGHFRRQQVWVGGREGIRWTEIPSAMHNWLLDCGTIWCFQNNDQMANWFKDCHIAFEKIHPFIDGNGRIGRMILNWHRTRASLPPLRINASERGYYYLWFQ